MPFESVPWDLKACNNWVCWRYEQRTGSKPTKVPVSPVTGQAASTTEKSTWSSFEVARQYADTNGLGLGFVFTDSPYAGIDLDATTDPGILSAHQRIAETMDSYAEVSPSGSGLHIIVRGSVPHGKKDTAKSVEVYSDGRYFTMTGNVYLAKPIVERNAALNELWRELSGERVELVNVEAKAETTSDDEILRRAATAANADKFKSLWDGDLTDHRNDHSAADQALMNLLGFYTQNREQIIRLFQRSALGKRDKAHRRDYLDRTVARALDQSISMSPVLAFQAKQAAPVEDAEDDYEDLADEAVTGFELVPDAQVPWPPGLVGQLAREIYGMSLFPRRRVSIGAALSFMSMTCGRSWHYPKLGFNLYLLVLGKTGLGKNDGIEGVTRVAQELDTFRHSVNADTQYAHRIRKEFVSKQGLHRDLSEMKSVLYIIDEFQIRLASLCNKFPSGPDAGIKGFLTANYGESNPYGRLTAITYSRKENSLQAAHRPNLCLFGLGVPTGFYNVIDRSLLDDGFLNRIVMLECPDFEDSVRNRAPVERLSDSLLTRLTDIADTAMFADAPGGESTAVDATSEVEKLDYHWSEHYRLKGSDLAKSAQARVAQNTMKVAGLLAIGENPRAPVITEEMYQWALGLVREGARQLIKKFDLGDTGTGDNKCLADAKRLLREYYNPQGKWQKKNQIRVMGEGIIAYRHMSRYLAPGQAFRVHTRGAAGAVDLVVKTLTDEGIITPAVVGKRGGKHFKLLVPWRKI